MGILSFRVMITLFTITIYAGMESCPHNSMEEHVSSSMILHKLILTHKYANNSRSDYDLCEMYIESNPKIGISNNLGVLFCSLVPA